MDTHKLYVGNLDYGVTSKELVELFSSIGEVVEAMVIPDRANEGKSKGFGFVTFKTLEEANRAISELNETDFKGRNLVVRNAN